MQFIAYQFYLYRPTYSTYIILQTKNTQNTRLLMALQFVQMRAQNVFNDQYDKQLHCFLVTSVMNKLH